MKKPRRREPPAPRTPRYAQGQAVRMDSAPTVPMRGQLVTILRVDTTLPDPRYFVRTQGGWDGWVAEFQIGSDAPPVEVGVTINKAADICGVSPAYLRMLIRDGQLQAVKVGREWTLPMAEVARFRDRRNEKEAG